VVGEQGGKWGKAELVPGTGALNVGGEGKANAVACVSAGNCVVAGQYMDKSKRTQAFVTGEAGGRWAVAEPVPGTIAVNTGGNADPASVACASAASCAIGGYYFVNAQLWLSFVGS